jgi:cell division septation protein DedD
MVTRTAEPELYKDKIEVSLDGRQIFYLFFGGAVVACLVFVLGVMVGRRLESRAHVDRAAATSATRDPLAALDRLAEGKGEMTFPAALGSSAPPPVNAVERVIEPPAPPPPVVEKPAEKPAAKPAEKKKPAADEPAPASKPDNDDKGKFTLQLSAFQDQAEAEAFLATVKGAGYRAYVVSAEVEGKGTFYRVRLGNYNSYDDAVAAKAEFERKVPKIAYVTRL